MKYISLPRRKGTKKRTNQKTEYRNPKKNGKSPPKRGVTGSHPRSTNQDQDPKSGWPLLKSHKSQISLGSRTHGARARGRARERQAHSKVESCALGYVFLPSYPLLLPRTPSVSLSSLIIISLSSLSQDARAVATSAAAAAAAAAVHVPFHAGRQSRPRACPAPRRGQAFARRRSRSGG